MSSKDDDVDLPISVQQHFKMYKPANVLSQFVFTHRKRKNRKLLGDVITSAALLPDGIMAIGRLDEDSEGLLLLTTDGKFSKRVREKDVEKEYWVQVNGRMTEEAMKKLRNGVEITLPSGETQGHQQSSDEPNRLYQTMPCHVKLLETKVIEVTQQNNFYVQQSSSNKQQNAREKFKGSCNKCGQTGHKNKDCTIYPMNQTLNNSDGVSSSETKLRMSLPTGIPPPTHNHHKLSEASQHGPSSWISITVTEGKYRQVRKMTAAIGHPTLRLVRVKIGSIVLNGMVEGEVRRLDEAEIESFSLQL